MSDGRTDGRAQIASLGQQIANPMLKAKANGAKAGGDKAIESGDAPASGSDSVTAGAKRTGTTAVSGTPTEKTKTGGGKDRRNTELAVAASAAQRRRVTALHCSALHCTALHCTALLCSNSSSACVRSPKQSVAVALVRARATAASTQAGHSLGGQGHWEG